MYSVVQEPPKRELVAYDNGKASRPARRAFCILQAWPKSPVVEAVVELSSSRPSVISWTPVQPQAQPLLFQNSKRTSACT